MESSVLALGIPMAAPPARPDGPSPRRDSHDAFGDMLGRALREDSRATAPGDASLQRPADDPRPDVAARAGARTAPSHAPAPGPSKPQSSRPADAEAVDRPVSDAADQTASGAIDQTVSDAQSPQKPGKSERRPEDPADPIDVSHRLPDQAEPALAVAGEPPPPADAPLVPPGWPGGIAARVEEESDDACGEEFPQAIDASFETAEAIEGDTAAAVPTAQGAATLPMFDTRGATPPRVPADPPAAEQEVPATGNDEPAPFGFRGKPEGGPELRRGAIPARPAMAQAPPSMAQASPSIAGQPRAPEFQAASNQDLGDPGLARRLAATAAGLVESTLEPQRGETAAALPVLPAVILDALRGARVSVSQVQPPPAASRSASAAAMAIPAGVLPDEAITALQDTTAAASALPLIRAYEQQAAATRGDDPSTALTAAGNELLRAALIAIGHTAGADSAGSDSSSGNGSRRGPTAPPAQAASAFARATVTSMDSASSLSMAAGLRPSEGADAEDLVSESPINGASLTRSFVQTVRVQVRQGGGEAHIRLNPEHLGEVSVLVKVDGSGVSATLRAESVVVRGWLEAHQQELRAALKEQGLSLDDLVIDADGRSRQEADAQAQQQRRPAQRRPMPGQQFEALI